MGNFFFLKKKEEWDVTNKKLTKKTNLAACT